MPVPSICVVSRRVRPLEPPVGSPRVKTVCPWRLTLMHDDAIGAYAQSVRPMGYTCDSCDAVGQQWLLFFRCRSLLCVLGPSDSQAISFLSGWGGTGLGCGIGCQVTAVSSRTTASCRTGAARRTKGSNRLPMVNESLQLRQRMRSGDENSERANFRTHRRSAVCTEGRRR